MLALRPRVYIGSSTERLEVAQAIETELTQRDLCDPVLWKGGAMFRESESFYQRLLASRHEFDFAVLVVSGEDVTEKRGQPARSPRDNILFELGLFMGTLGSERTLMLYDEDDEPELPTDLSGVASIPYHRRPSESAQQAAATVCAHLAGIFTRCGPLSPCHRLQHRTTLRDLLRTGTEDRVFGLFRDDGHSIFPVTLGIVLDACLDRGITCWSDTVLCIRRLTHLLQEDKALKNVDFSLIADSQSAMPGLLDMWRPDIPEYELWLSGRFPVPDHRGPFPPDGLPHETVVAWTEMHNVAKQVLQAIYMSPYRVVLSHFLDGHMTVTAGRTSKATLIPYFHTPIVAAIEPEPGHYFGSPKFPPSSETRPHWRLHQILADRDGLQPSAIIHCHPRVLIDWLKTEDSDGELLPADGILEHEPFATDELGGSLAQYLPDRRSAILREHGVWTVGRSFAEALGKLLGLSADVSRVVGENLSCC